MADENQSGVKHGDDGIELAQQSSCADENESSCLKFQENNKVNAQSNCLPDDVDNNMLDVINTSTSIEESKCTTEEKIGESSRDKSMDTDNMIQFRVIWNKKHYEVTFNTNETIGNLKKHIEALTGLPASMQKLMFKGLVKDDTKTLSDLKVTNYSKMMVIGSTVKDIMAVNIQASAKALKEETSSSVSSKEPWSKQKMHRKILDKGKPDDAMPGDKTKKEPLPRVPISGMLNKAAGKVRLTFKLEQDQLWIGTKERTEKVSMGSIKNVLSEPIEGHEDYHVLAIQLGPTEASRYWVYWVPAQYVDAIKDTILGMWQSF